MDNSWNHEKIAVVPATGGTFTGNVTIASYLNVKTSYSGASWNEVARFQDFSNARPYITVGNNLGVLAAEHDLNLFRIGTHGSNPCLKFSAYGTQIDSLPGTGIIPNVMLSLKSAGSNYNCLRIEGYSEQESNLVEIFNSDNTMLFNIDSFGNCSGGTSAAQSLGSTSINWKNIYLQDAPIIASDQREKDNLRELTAEEIKVADLVLGLVYQQQKSIQEKGPEEARLHFGISAQQLVESFELAGLDPYRYSINIADWWYEYTEAITGIKTGSTTDAIDAQPEISRLVATDNFDNIPKEFQASAVLKNKLAIRYSELYALLFFALKARVTNIEKKLEQLEATISEKNLTLAINLK